MDLEEQLFQRGVQGAIVYRPGDVLLNLVDASGDRPYMMFQDVEDTLGIFEDGVRFRARFVGDTGTRRSRYTLRGDLAGGRRSRKMKRTRRSRY